MTANSMFGILLHIALLLQGLPLPPNQGGTVTGLLMSEGSRPAVGVRVAVVEQPANPADAGGTAALVSIAETDEAGRFRLENVPPGRYYIAAGRVEVPTFYPGTLEIAGGKIVTVAAGETVAGVNFSIKDVSDRGVETIHTVLRIPIQVNANGTRIPIYAENGKVRLRLTHVSDGTMSEALLDAPSVALPTAVGEYQVRIENLPPDMELRGLSFGGTNLLTGKLKVTLADLPDPEKGEQVSLTGTQTGIVVQRRIQTPSTNFQAGAAYGNMTSKSALTLTLVKKNTAEIPPSGVTVSGKVFSGQEEAYISGKPGRLFADGSFEFRDVSPGPHIVFTLGASSTSRQLSAVVNVGTVNVENLQLMDTILLPLDVMSPAVNAKGLRVEGAVPATHMVTGHVVAEATHLPVAGIVTVKGFNRSITYSLPADGEFEIPDLLPGSYGLKIETFDRGTLTRNIVIADSDIDLPLSVPAGPSANDK